jgi:L-aminopeptidase/D-esterase-like protein
MKWLRLNAKRLSMLALFALALQFGLSFGHIHADHAFAASTAISDHASASTADGSGHQQDNPADLCAICVTVAMANALVDATPPVLPVPLDTKATEVLADFTQGAPATRLVAFHSRGPPQS